MNGGNYKFISNKVSINENIVNQAKYLADEGKTPLFFAKDNEFLGIIAVADVIDVRKKFLPIGGELDPTAGTEQQGGIQLCFQRLDHLTDGGLGIAQFLSGFRETA